MALRDWLPATATPATPATLGRESRLSVATVAIVAVAESANEGAQPDVATPVQAEELHALIPLAFPGISATDAAEVLAVASADPEGALTSFRALAADERERRQHEG